MNYYLELSVPFVTSGATIYFFYTFSFPLISLNYSSFEPHKHGSVAPGSPSEGRKKNSLAMYKKEQVKPKMLFLMSFLCCSLVSIFVTVIIWWRFPNCTKRHGNGHTTTWNFRLLKKLLSQNLVVLVKLIVDGNWIYSFENISSCFLLIVIH